jgi:nucleoid DNA-binding protein
MELGKHISYLLKFHECVVVPDFGGFISNYKPAEYDRTRGIFSPPSKEVVFNARIKNNDGLLIRYIAVSEKCSYGEAEHVVEHFVDGVYQSLNSGEMVDVASVGTFHFNRSGAMVFDAVSTIEMASSYGLQPFSYAMSTTDSSMRTVMQPYRASRTLNKRREAIKIAAGVALLLSLSLFPLKNDNPSLQSSNVNPIQLLARSSGVLENDAALIQSVDLEEIQQATPYVLIGGSFSHEANARDMQFELTAKGFNSEIIKNKDGLFRVVIDSYFDRQEAINAMRAYRSGHPGSNVWVSTR